MDDRPRREKEIIGEMDSFMKSLKQRLSTHLKQFDSRAAVQANVLKLGAEMARSRAEIEQNYAAATEKFAKSYQRKLQQAQNDVEGFDSAHIPLFHSLETIIQTADQTARHHQVLGQLLREVMAPQFDEAREDTTARRKAVQPSLVHAQERLVTAVQNISVRAKTYHKAHQAQLDQQISYNGLEQSWRKMEAVKPDSNKTRELQKYDEKRNEKKDKLDSAREVLGARLSAATNARNDYIIAIDVANRLTEKYFNENLPDVLEAMELNTKTVVAQGYRTYAYSHIMMKDHHDGVYNDLQSSLASYMSICDQSNFISAAFDPTEPHYLQPHRGDMITTAVHNAYAPNPVPLADLKIPDKEHNLSVVSGSLKELRSVSEQTCCFESYVVTSRYFDTFVPQELIRRRQKKAELIEMYVNKLDNYLTESDKLAECVVLQKVMESTQARPDGERSSRGISRPAPYGKPKLFGGNIEDYAQFSGCLVPDVVQSTIDYLRRHALETQGIFRVSGSVNEINELKAQFENMRNPLVNENPNSPINVNSVAALLKQYFRELQPPIFCKPDFHTWMAVLELETVEERVALITSYVSHLHKANRATLRYLFDFLSHLSEHSAENRMTSYNVAVCFAPSLLPIPHGDDQDQEDGTAMLESVQFQSTVHKLIELVRTHSDCIFTDSSLEPKYSRTGYDSRQSDDVSLEEESLEPTTPVVTTPRHSDASLSFDPDAVPCGVARYDFKGRNDQELSVKRGDTFILVKQMSSDWWKVNQAGKEGLVPTSYVKVLNSSPTASSQQATPLSSSATRHSKPPMTEKTPKAERTHRLTTALRPPDDNRPDLVSDLPLKTGVVTPDGDRAASSGDEKVDEEQPSFQDIRLRFQK